MDATRRTQSEREQARQNARRMVEEVIRRGEEMAATLAEAMQQPMAHQQAPASVPTIPDAVDPEREARRAERVRVLEEQAAELRRESEVKHADGQ